ncbi:MAG: tail fiber protein [Sphingomonas sp.]|jgi:microcystin-dependent protein|uniref:phage tail protein n=1 Tax=Sphingomonas sp. TaxID=28214 RepID=UPI003568BC8F
MSNPFLGEIRMFAGNFAPRGFALCAGQLMSIAQNDALYALIGTTYGGDGQVTFGLPDMRGRLPINQGQGPSLSNYVIGQMAGTESVTLTVQQMPAHSHLLSATTATGSQPAPTNTSFTATLLGTAELYAVPGANPLKQGALNTNSISALGGNQPHENRMPALVINFIIALEGVFPSRN